MWQKYPSLQKKLYRTMQLMDESIQLKNKEVEQAIISMIHAGGKLLRPAYCLLFSELVPQQDTEKSIALAAAIETLHTATLIHDDIVDRADTRRGLETVQKKFGNDVAVYAGDYLFIICFRLLADYSSSLKSIQMQSNSMEKVLNGELGQMNKRYDTTMTVAQYLENIKGKTGELFALSSFIGAYENGCSLLLSNKCRMIGESTGIAFQIIDDVLDYHQTAAHIGKPVLEDVRQGIYSLPLLLAMEQNKDAFLPLLNKRESMTPDDAQQIWQLVQKYQGVQKAEKIATTYTKKSLQAIKKLPENKLQTKQTLYTLTEELLKRTT